MPSCRNLATLKGTPVSTSAADTYRSFLMANGGTGRSIRELERSFFAGKAIAAGSINSMWNLYLVSKGFTNGGVSARQIRFFNTFTGTV